VFDKRSLVDCLTMILNHQYIHLSSLILLIIFVSSTTSKAFCSNLTSVDDKDKPCFLEPPVRNPLHLRTSGNSLVLPCHVARSKHATIEWWYQDFQKTVSFKIYPVFPPVRPTAHRFMTSVLPTSQNANETDIIDVSILLRHINVDDKGIYRCVIRSWSSDRFRNMNDNPHKEVTYLPALTYHVHSTGPRLCQQSLGSLPCFASMITSSPTIIDAYQTTFLQCVVRTANRPITIFWVAGNATENSVLITDYLTKNQHKGDRLRRVFPLSPFDYSIELTINRDTRERTYSCVIDGATDAETTLFTYVVRSIQKTSQHHLNQVIHSHDNQTVVITESATEQTKNKTEPIVSHDSLTANQISALREKTAQKKTEEKSKHVNVAAAADDDDLFPELHAREEKSTRR